MLIPTDATACACITHLIYLAAALREAQGAGIQFTQRPILRFFAPQGPHVAPMGVKFGVEEGTKGPLLHAKVPSSTPNFTHIGAMVRV